MVLSLRFMLESFISLFACEEPRKRLCVIIGRGKNRLKKVTMEMKHEMKQLYVTKETKKYSYNAILRKGAGSGGEGGAIAPLPFNIFKTRGQRGKLCSLKLVLQINFF